MRVKITEPEMLALTSAGLFEDPGLLSEGEEAVRSAVVDGHLVCFPNQVDAISSGLTEIANAADERAEDPAVDPLYRSWARADRRHVTALQQRFVKAIRGKARA